MIGLRTDSTKLGDLSNWVQLTDRIRPESIEAEFYDYATPGGRRSWIIWLMMSGSRPRWRCCWARLSTGSCGLSCRPICGHRRRFQKGAYLAYEALLVNLPAPNSEPGFRPDLVGYGRDF